MSDELMELQEGWEWINFSEVIEKIKRGPSKKCNTEGLGIRYITSGNLQNGELHLDLDYKFLDDLENIDGCRLVPGDLILNCVNSLERIGKSAIFRESHGEAIVGFNNYALELDNRLIFSEYANICCQSDFFQKQLYFLVKRAVNQVSFATRELNLLKIPLPPLNEQKRIVAKIEELRERSQKARSALSAIPELCDKFRQSVLAAAFRGDLTADWREQNPDVEPASVLLERIRDDRYKDWELEQLAKASHKSTKLDNEKLRMKYEFPTSPQEDRLFKELEGCIPDSWTITSLDSVARLITGKTPSTSEADYWDGEIPFVTPTEIAPTGFILPSRRLVTQLGAKQAKILPSDSTLIVCIGTVGKVGILSSPSVINQQINALVPLKSVSYKFIYYWAQALKPWIVANAAATVNAAILNKSRLGMAPIPIPPYLEQLHIVSMIEAMLSEISSLTSNITNTCEWLNSLDRSILAKAFRGELVEQDPNDEPASVLLERIRAEREQQTQGKAKKPGKKGRRTIKTE